MVPTAEHFDVVVIGGGPGGYATALYGASAGLNVAMIEHHKLGGTCLNVGCIPAKELLETAAAYLHASEAKDYGVSVGEPTIDWSVSLGRKDTIVTGLVSGLASLLKGRKVTVYDGRGRLHAGRTVSVSGGSSGDVELTGDAVVLAPGSLPRTLPGFDVDGKVVMTSDEFLSLPELPKRAAIIGGGVVGCEFASLLSDLGTEVTILEALPKILPGLDKDLTSVIEKSFKKRGITVRTGVQVEGHTPGDGGTSVQVAGESLDVDLVVVSVGRRPNTDDLGLDGTGVKLTDRGFIEVDEHCRTGEPAVWAVGDAIATPALAHIAFIEGVHAVQDILGEDPAPVDYAKVPWCVYTRPEAAFTGLSEEAAKEAGLQVITQKSRFNHNGRAMIVNQAEGMVKVIAEKDADGNAGRILGVHMVGPWVTEQLGQGYLAVNWEATVADMADLIQPHPTMTEVLGEAMIAITGRPLHG
ncbi:MAG: dihydrolipoyl dehydrogenase [Actinomycetota bacterium]|nr:dihydrolipoyl dehydrogenase [Actinomycetota bacterium]